MSSTHRTLDSSATDHGKRGGLRPPDDERIPYLIDRFLENVHTKNPILDVDSLVEHGQRCAEQGVGWGPWSCLFGSIAKPFASDVSPNPVPSANRTNSPAAVVDASLRPQSSSGKFARELRQAETYFILACRRLGSLTHTMLGAQCHFFAGGASPQLRWICIKIRR